MTAPQLTECEIERYSRQLVLPGWGSREQARLKQITAAVDAELISAGVYLAAAGCGRIAVIGQPAGSTAILSHLKNLNPEIEVTDGLPKQPAGGELARIVLAPATAGSADHLIEITLAPKALVLALSSADGEKNRLSYDLPDGIDPAVYAGICAASLLLSRLVGANPL